MKPDFSEIKENINYFVSSFFISELKNIINECIAFSYSFQKKFDDYYRSSANSIEHINDYNRKTTSLIEDKFVNAGSINFDKKFPQFNEELNNYFLSFEKSIKEVQLKDRFIIAGQDSFYIKNLKRTKKLFYNLSQLPVITGNAVRKIFKKEMKPERDWYHEIPFRNYSIYYLRNKLSNSLLQLFEETSKAISSAYFKIWGIDENINKIFTLDSSISELENLIEVIDFKIETDDIVKELKNLISSLDEKASEKIDKMFLEYEDVYNKTGTIEEPKSKYDSIKVTRAHENLNYIFKEEDQGWQNSYFILFEGWRLNKELYIICGKSAKAYSDIKRGSEERINNKIIPELRKVPSLLEEIKEEINDFYGSSGELHSLLFKQKNKIAKNLAGRIIPSLSEVILAQNIPELVGGIEITIEKLVQSLSPKRAVIKSSSYVRKIKTTEIDYISPKEIIYSDSLAKFSRSIQHVKSKVLTEIQNVQNSILNIDQISDFNLDTAISMFSSEERTGEDPLDIAVEGIERAVSKTNEVERNLRSIIKEIEETVCNAIGDFDSDLIKLTKAENILDIKIKIAKAKALQRTTKLKESSVIWIKNLLPFLRSSYQKEHSKYTEFYIRLRKRIGLTPKISAISSEISDFLSATQTALSKLPVVYRRLFEIEALKDERFFEGRESELGMLNSAYENWKKGGYAPVAVVGEKGTGATTLLNFFETVIEKKHNILRTEIICAIYNPDNLKEFFNDFLKTGHIKSFEELINYLNNLPFKQIIIIENIQHLFLRKVNGFICLKILFELISKTQRNIFWITTASLYSWEYLNKTLNIADYFGYIVKLKSLKDEQMVAVILKRHKISGYNLKFKPSKQEEENKNFKKMREEKKQEYLSRQYFSDLNKFAKSNISLALLFWLRSTTEVSDSTITIGSLKDIDFSFLNSLNGTKIFTLHSLLIHDGLTIESFSIVSNLPEDESRLMLFVLLDDGIIIQRNGLYKINPLLYRQAVTLLQTKNIIH